MTDLLAELSWRGLVQDTTPGLPERLAKGPITAYVGFDPTAPSLQVGNLVPIMLLAHLQRAGGKAMVVMGGGTGMIGDPSGKNEERPLLDQSVLDANVRTQETQFRQLLPGVQVVNNATWLRPLSLVEFLRDVGKHFPISLMLQKESVKARMEQGISYTEFSYMLTQAYDFWHLYRECNCEMQMGGSDQWGNITAGIELIRRREGKEAHGLSAPLMTTAGGTKFGKTEGRAVWLDQRRTAPVMFYNFWVNVDDRDVERFLRMFTFKSDVEIKQLMAEHERDPGARVPHHALASAVTDWIRPGTSEGLRETMREAISEMASGDLVHTIEEFCRSLEKFPEWQWDRHHPPRPEDLFVAAGLATSKSDARRLIAGKGLYLNRKVPQSGDPVPESEVQQTEFGRFVLLQKGKKNYQPLRITGLD
ncbi:MAG: tyrosine--tRNA ligase [Gemmatimonadetes bacterium]|nr:tyrosine--tRNA ligase [Gemmatimonadota bacterium]